MEVAARVEQEEREEDEVEEVDRRDAEQIGADHRVVADPAEARTDTAAFPRCAGRIRSVDLPQEEGRPEERPRVERKGVRAAQELDEHAAEARSGEKGKAARPMEQRVARDVVLALHDRLEEAAVAHVEEDARAAKQERD